MSDWAAMLHYYSLIAVAVGGAIGSLARLAALEIATGDVEVVSTDVAAQPAVLVTLAVNVLGSMLIGILFARQPSMTSTQFLAAGTGFAGGLTTFSTFAVAVADSLDNGQTLSALSNGIGTALAAVLAAGIGYRLGAIVR